MPPMAASLTNLRSCELSSPAPVAVVSLLMPAAGGDVGVPLGAAGFCAQTVSGATSASAQVIQCIRVLLVRISYLLASHICLLLMCLREFELHESAGRTVEAAARRPTL